MSETFSKTCPQCASENFGVGSGEPVTVSGWYGDRQFGWGSCARIHVVRLTGLRCGDCGHEVSVDPDWDKPAGVSARIHAISRRMRNVKG
jgi:hypothetical protein